MAPDSFLRAFKQMIQIHKLKMAGLVDYSFKYLNDKVEQ
jgi:hypothetical protein